MMFASNVNLYTLLEFSVQLHLLLHLHKGVDAKLIYTQHHELVIREVQIETTMRYSPGWL